MKELLQRWSELESDRCYSVDEEDLLFELRTGPIDEDWATICVKGSRWRDFAFLGAGVKQAIDDRNLRVKIENASDGWYVTLTTADDPAIDCLTSHHDAECSIALLKAYVAWLENRP